MQKGLWKNEELESLSLQTTQETAHQYTHVKHLACAQHALNSMGDTRDAENIGPAFPQVLEELLKD